MHKLALTLMCAYPLATLALTSNAVAAEEGIEARTHNGTEVMKQEPEKAVPAERVFRRPTIVFKNKEKKAEEEAKEKAKKALSLVGLGESYYSQSPFELSGGQKRRVAIAGVLAMRPKVLVLDEPTAGLDPKGRDEILEQIAYLHKESDLTVILVSHSMEDIARYADRLIVMNSGEVMYNDTPKNVFAHYQELEKVGLAAPQVTYIMHDLKMKGFPVSVTATTVEEAADEIMHALGRQ